ncbi:MAG: DUF1549 and DUF1553 domain-containing protein, partial [Planctomycetaceae bacterium]
MIAMKQLAQSAVGFAVLWAMSAVAIGADPAAAPGAPAAHPEPKLEKLEVFPANLDLADVRDIRRLLVTGITADGTRFDVSRDAAITPASKVVSIDADGFVVPETAGTTELKVAARGLEAKVPVVVKDTNPRPVSFVSEVIPAISKVGCNMGTCHGSQQGRAGFKLSLRGYDPLFDYTALVDDISGRRFNRAQPAQSLMLLKPTQGVPHEGGFLFDEESRYYKILHQWIAEGCNYDATAHRVDRIEVFPSAPLLQHMKDVQQLIVIAHYNDGTSRDVTREAVFDTSNFEVATLGKTGLIEAVRRGEAAALVRFEGLYAAAPVTVLGEREGYKWVDSPEYNFVDTHVNEKLRRMKILPSELCTDSEFLRRISLDLTGLPPTSAQTRAFLADERPTRAKREAKIDELLNSPLYVEHWTLKWSDLLLNNRKFVSEKGVWAFRNWIRSSLASDKPYDKFAYELMTADGSTFDNPAANYFRVAREPKVVMENMTQVFLGTRFNCNQCHDHPFERWTQKNYYGLAAYFASVGRKDGTRPGEEIIYSTRNPQPVIHPGTGQNVTAAFPFEHPGMDKSITDNRKKLAQWLTAPQNPYFAKSIANRYWSYFTGRGIIDPVDDIRASNPPSNPELLDALTDDFVNHNLELRHLIRTIATSHTYQRSYKTNEWNKDDVVSFSHAMPRRLAAEQLFDALVVATGAPSDIPGMPAGFRASQLPDPTVDVGFLDMFGRAPRESPCECERTSEVSLAQTLSLVNGPTISDAIIHPKGLIARLTAEKADSRKMVEEVYLAVVCRLPTDAEKKQGEEYLASVANPVEATQDLMWALINSPEFLFNR